MRLASSPLCRSPRIASGVRPARWLPRVVLLLIAVGLSFVGRSGAALGQGASDQLSPEEAVTRLAPYLLTAGDLPDGYQIDQVGAATAVTFGFDRNDPPAAFRQNAAAGLVVFVQQSLSTADLFAPLSIDSLDLYLMRDAEAAHAFALGSALPPDTSSSVTLSPVDLGLKLGETSSSFRAVLRFGLFDRTVIYQIRWQQGRLGLELDASLDPQNATPQQLAALAQRLAQREAAVTVPDFSASTVPAPATEEMRAAALQHLQSLDVPAAVAPPGYRAPTHDVTSVANLVAGHLDQADILPRIDLQWKRLIEADEYFASTSSFVRVGISVAQDADAAGAVADERDILLQPGEAINFIDAPLALGDTMLALRTGYDSDDGIATEGQQLVWTHGSLLLAVSMVGPPGTTKMDEIVVFARLLEQQYQASPFAAGASALR